MTALSSLKKDELLDLAKKQQLTTTTKMTKKDLIDLLENKTSKEPAKKPVAKKVSPTKEPAKKPVAKKVSPTKEPAKTVAKKDSPAKAPTKTVATIKASGIKVPKPQVKKVEVPTKNMHVQFNDHITVLPQSNNTVLIVWNADPNGDDQVKAWKLSNRLGLDILLPAYSRSLFIDISLLALLDFALYKIYHNETKELFAVYQEQRLVTYPHPSTITPEDRLVVDQPKGHPSSANHYIDKDNGDFKVNTSSSHFFRKNK